ncbi:hypothetical protein Syn7502_02277 [Synechococcus sp. PCC 7502]|uniref:hypothetical protein n=1 Tax=Synechococcus sp. PCC 7502 TaxID=1173263 RepID=UPI00029FDD3E|nr:hypothetical protein [Synechococcus sp. PCC 7502]AFY74282.1 hypothetical protein Syn7502_02277 [Synechococcus sp. PCC 7502]
MYKYVWKSIYIISFRKQAIAKVNSAIASPHLLKLVGTSDRNQINDRIMQFLNLVDLIFD